MNKKLFKELTGENPEDVIGNDFQNTFDDYEEEDNLDTICPNCNSEYDEIDQEYQICHKCKFNNNKTKTE